MSIYFLPDDLWTVPPLRPMAPSRSLCLHVDRLDSCCYTLMCQLTNAFRTSYKQKSDSVKSLFHVGFSGRHVFIVDKNKNARLHHRFVFHLLLLSLVPVFTPFVTTYLKCSDIRLDVLEKPLDDQVRTSHNHQDVDTFNCRTSVISERCSSDCKMESFEER